MLVAQSCRRGHLINMYYSQVLLGLLSSEVGACYGKNQDVKYKITATDADV